MIRILIADDHFVVRHGLERILRKEFPSARIEEVADGEDMVKRVMESEWDLVISDLSMPGRNGLEALHQIKEHFPKLPILILSVHPEEQYAIRVLRAGASGYLNKDMAPEELINAVHRVLLGRKYITPTIAEKLAERMNGGDEQLPHEQLSDREFEVLKLLAAGKSLTDIGSMLSISPTTVGTYRARILAKMNFKTNADLTRYAVLHNLV
ncbi:MAG: response regulator transcription factor [Bacteroidetes bacterium]|nr:response regulator transcription factor [Bacteroidota bacterium]